jgi:hypothetical protein
MVYELGKQNRSVESLLEELNNTAGGIFIQLSRIYDLLAAQAAGADTQQAVALLNMHEQGIIFTEAPVLQQFGGNTQGAADAEETSKE